MKFEDLIKIDQIKLLEFETWEHEFFEDMLELIEAEKVNQVGGGIYRMFDETGQIIYVGKSNDLHRRLLQHIGKRTNTAYFINQVKKIEFHVENNPIFQTMLEGIFIAYHKPKFNDEVKDSLRGAADEHF